MVGLPVHANRSPFIHSEQYAKLTAADSLVLTGEKRHSHLLLPLHFLDIGNEVRPSLTDHYMQQ